MQCYPNKFVSHLNKGLQSYYLIFGDEPQQKLSAIESLRTLAKAQGFDERQSLVVDAQFSWNSLYQATQSLSLFSAKIYIELELPTGKPGTEGAKLLSQLASQPSADTIIMIHGAKIGRDVQQSKWFKSLDKHGVYVPCYPLEGNALSQWVAQQLNASGLASDPQNCKLLCDFCEGNLLAAKQEIDKLALLYPDGHLTPEKIEKSVVDQSKYNVFQLVDVLLAGDAQRSIKLLYRLESEGIEPNIILWALIREWQTLHQLVFLKQQGSPINWNQFRIWKNRQGFYQAALQRLSETQLNKIQQKLSVLDSRLKQSVVPRPYIEICHICLMFMPFALDEIALG